MTELLGRFGLAPWLDRLERGLDTVLAPWGHPVSGGELQRLSVARAVLTGRPVLVLDGVGFLHDGGRVSWARTVLVAPDGTETVVFGDHEDRPDPAALEKTKITVAGLKKGTKVRVLFEDREVLMRLAHDIRNIPFRVPGIYFFQLCCEHTVVADVRVRLRRVARCALVNGVTSPICARIARSASTTASGVSAGAGCGTSAAAAVFVTS